ncbi:MAG: bifunctional metallophosphatase/5'-nucleotidase [Candidatus Geothermincolia bacterium]
MSKKHWTRTLIVMATLVLVCAIVAVPMGGSVAGKPKASATNAKNFTILHTNDEHSQLIPYGLAIDYPNAPTTGGFSRLAKTMADIKTAKAAVGEPVLTMGAGDWSQGTLFSWLETTVGPELTLMQQMGYDAVAIGNHDVELGPQYLAAELAAAKGNGVNLPVLSSNIIFTGYPPNPASPDFGLYTGFYSATDRQRADLFIQPYTTKTLPNGLKVGMFGMLGVEAETVAPGAAPLKFGNVPGDDTASFVNRVNVANNTVNTLRNTEKCDVVVCISHMGTYEEKQLATYVSGIDVIIGGHSHSLNYPPIIAGQFNTIIVQAKAQTEYLGNLELQHNPAAPAATSKVSVRNASVIHMDQTIGTVPAIDTVISGFLGGINGSLGFDCLAPFAETDLNKDGGFGLMEEPPLAETNLGDLIADSYRTVANQVDPAHPSQIGIEANGVIWRGLPKGARGIFSFYDLYGALPLGGSPYDATTPGYPMVSFYLMGAEIQGVMEQLIDLGRNDFFLQTSGMKYSYDPNAPAGKKVVSVLVDNGAGVYEPIKPMTLYKLAANYYTGAFMGAFGLYPRDATGAQHKPPTYPDPMQDFILHTGPNELKCWQALTNNVANMPDLDGDGLPNIPQNYYTIQDRITRMATTFYLAEGTTRPDFDTYISIQNPGGTDAHVVLTYYKGNGKTSTQNITVPGNSRNTVHPADILGVGNDPAYDFSTKVVCTNGQEIIVERPMYFNYNGVWNGGHDVMGATSLGTVFYFAEGTCRPNFDPYFCIQNPNNEDAFLRFTYSKGDGTTQEQLLLVPKNSRYTERVKATLGEGDDAAHDFSAKIECFNDLPILIERPMYFNYKSMWTGGSDVVGAAAPNSKFYFAEGSCRPGFEPYFCIQNTTSIDSPTTITYMKGDGTTETQTLTVPMNSRATVVVKDKLGEGDDAAHDFSASVVSNNDTPLVVERPVYADYQGMWTGGHDVIGDSYPSKTFYFAEGTCRPGFDAYITMQNPGNHDAAVKITYMTGDGKTKTQDIMIPVNARVTVHPADVLGIGDDAAHDFSVKVECTNGRTIVAERPMYFDFNGWTGASCVIGQ